ncbi:hypothetical protein HZF05_02935 [Sphingomonas sp. CGMCC 1.13654]|uniref:Uncharacterized protein n=1 Tax=Sphingomonas chungangi TaxID=2683589 RepID=A0A838L321_9SPHN|nr:hypothetical protein [Sphingomonas chungangi]MBA2933045.1 hypothetical protein [Sphingomonas chungangi]MVW56665.1 hypothetical protein [Sphingomonas chungangi]
MRLLARNGLSFDMLEQIVGLSPETVAGLEAGQAASLDALPLDDAKRERLALFCATLLRFEIRLGHEPAPSAR